MLLSEVKAFLQNATEIQFQLENGTLVPEHFHVTEVGLVTKKFIDCGGTLREEETINFQLWYSTDYNHRIHPEKLTQIIEASEKTLGGLPDRQVEVEYQDETIGKYFLEVNNKGFVLTNKQTACLAEDACGVPTPNKTKRQEKPRIRIGQAKQVSCCDPSSGCC